MSDQFIAELGVLTGAELYALIDKLVRARLTTSTALTVRLFDGQQTADFVLVSGELESVFNDVAMQLARITVPLQQAQATIARAAFRGHRPVRVPGTT